jgi:predicted phage tail protein
VILSWKAPASDGGSPVTSYRVYQGTAPGAGAGAVVSTAAVTRTTLAGLANGTTYYFRVTAVNAAGRTGTSSAEVSATPGAATTVSLTPQAASTPLIASLAAVSLAATAGAFILALRYRQGRRQLPHRSRRVM